MYLNCYLETDSESLPSVVYSIDVNDDSVKQKLKELEGQYDKLEFSSKAPDVRSEIQLMSSLFGIRDFNTPLSSLTSAFGRMS